MSLSRTQLSKNKKGRDKSVARRLKIESIKAEKEKLEELAKKAEIEKKQQEKTELERRQKEQDLFENDMEELASLSKFEQKFANESTASSDNNSASSETVVSEEPGHWAGNLVEGQGPWDSTGLQVPVSGWDSEC